jgi:hypothetical protein
MRIALALVLLPIALITLVAPAPRGTALVKAIARD